MHICHCADPWCRANGCRILADQAKRNHDQLPFKQRMVPDEDAVRKHIRDKDEAALKDLPPQDLLDD